MLKFLQSFIDVNSYISRVHKPDFNNLLKVLRREKTDKPVLFEFFMNDDLYLKLSGYEKYTSSDTLSMYRVRMEAFRNAGYDYVTVHGSDFKFDTDMHMNEGKKTISLNEGAVIRSWENFEEYNWPDPCSFDYSRLEKLSGYLPDGMKLIVCGPGGVLENVISLVGYEKLCFMTVDDPELAGAVFDSVGSRLVKYYEICSGYDTVGALISNDDWGFNTQTMLSAGDMRKYVIPWHKRIAEAIHRYEKPAILHSCGRLDTVMDDIIDVIKYDGKHSFEDNIMPIEAAYEKWGSRIALLGGVDLDFICRSGPEEVYYRSAAMLEKACGRGGYALGSGNSIPYFVPDRNYLAMIAAANFF